MASVENINLDCLPMCESDCNTVSNPMSSDTIWNHPLYRRLQQRNSAVNRYNGGPKCKRQSFC